MSNPNSIIEYQEKADISPAIERAIEAGRKTIQETGHERECLDAIIELTTTMGNNPPKEIHILESRYEFNQNDREFYRRLSEVLKDPSEANALEIQGALSTMFDKAEYLWKVSKKDSNEYFLGNAWHDASIEFQQKIRGKGLDLAQPPYMTPI